MAKSLTQEYGRGYSVSNLNDMRRFYENFQILQALSVESSKTRICQPLAGKSTNAPILQAVPVESSDQSSRSQIDQAPSDQMRSSIRQKPSSEFLPHRILQTVSGESSTEAIWQALPAESSDRILIDFNKHFHLGWSHYRFLLGQNDPQKRKFYFEQTATQRWSTRELQRQMDGALFERVALSHSTHKLVTLEKKKGLRETVSYEDIFKDPYLLDFLGLKGAYSEISLLRDVILRLRRESALNQNRTKI